MAKLKDVGSKVGSARAKASTTKGKGVYRSKANNMVAANAALKRYAGRGR